MYKKNTETILIDIPKGQYCHGAALNEVCKHWKFLGTTILHRNKEEAERIAEDYERQGYTIYSAKICPHAENCKFQCWTSPSTECQISVCRCEHLHFTDEAEDTLLWDMCKECGENEEDEDDEDEKEN